MRVAFSWGSISPLPLFHTSRGTNLYTAVRKPFQSKKMLKLDRKRFFLIFQWNWSPEKPIFCIVKIHYYNLRTATKFQINLLNIAVLSTSLKILVFWILLRNQDPAQWLKHLVQTLVLGRLILEFTNHSRYLFLLNEDRQSAYKENTLASAFLNNYT